MEECTTCGDYEVELVPLTEEELQSLPPTYLGAIEQPEQFKVKGFVVKEPETVLPEGLEIEVITEALR